MKLFLYQMFPEVSHWFMRGFTVTDHVKLAAEYVDNVVAFQLVIQTRDPPAM